MKYVSEFRDPVPVKNLIQKIKSKVTQSWKIMEICGGQTHTIVKYQLEKLLPKEIELIHGPGCPVCVTPESVLDDAIELSTLPNFILTSFGDLMRVPSSTESMLQVRARGGDIRIVYSPLDAVKLAQENPNKEVVFLSIGFETTTAPNALAILQAERLGLKNFSVLISQVRVPPAIESMLNDKETLIHGFLAAGHVCTIMGLREYQPLVEKYKVPIVVTGFEPTDILSGVLDLVERLESNKIGFGIQYTRSVQFEGNLKAQTIIDEVFEIIDQEWRGLGLISKSGFGLKQKYSHFNARLKFNNKFIQNDKTLNHNLKIQCQSGSILKGILKPNQCLYFAKECRPEHPLGAPMVSSEGACAAYFKYASQSTTRSENYEVQS